MAMSLGLLGGPRLAFAQADAEALLDEGKKLMKKGKLAEACPKLEESYALSPRSTTLLALASCHEKQGKIATAWSEYIDLGAAARKEGNKRLEADARARGARLEPRLPRLTLRVPRAAAVEGLELMLDGVPVDRSAWGQARPVDPGAHKVSASAPGRKRWEASVSIKRSERKAVTVPVLAKDPAAAPAKPAQAAEAPAPGAAGPGKGTAEPEKKAAAPGKGATAEPEKKAAAPGKGAEGPEKSAQGPGKGAPEPETGAAGPEEGAAVAAAATPAPDSSPRHSGSLVVDVGVAGGALIGLIDAGSFGNLSSYSYSYLIPEGELIASCNDDVCRASFDPAIGPFIGGHASVGLALSEDLHLGVRALGGYRFGGGYLLVGGPSLSMRFGRVWLGLTGLGGWVAQEAKVTGVKGEIPSQWVDLNHGRTQVDVITRESSLPESALVETLAFGGSVEVSVVLVDLPSSSWTSGALLLSVWPTFMKGLDGLVIAAPVSLGYRFY